MRPAPAREAIRDAICASEGMTYHQLMRAFKISDGSATGHVTRLLKLGQVVKRGGTSWMDPATFYAPEKAPPERVLQPRKNPIREANRGLDHKQETIIPKDVKVTRCPSADPGMRFRSSVAPKVINAQESREWAKALRTGA